MARFGEWKPLASNWASQPRMTSPDIICLHTMVGSLAGTDGMFRRNGFGGVFSHFGVGGDGSCIQWQDTDYRAAANLNGNHHIISVECADMGAPFPAWNTNDGSAVPAFSDAQLKTLAELIRTIAPAHNIPIVLIPDAKPGRRGIGYHRLGVPGYMVAGAEQWSNATGKVCPGNRRIAQIPQIIAAATAGGSTPAPVAQEEDDDMPQAVTAQVPAGESRHISFPPAQSGAAGWGPAWLTVRTDCFTEPPAPVEVRLALQGLDGKYRALPGTNGFDTTINPGMGLAGVVLAKGDCGLVVTATTQPVSVLVEYAKA